MSMKRDPMTGVPILGSVTDPLEEARKRQAEHNAHLLAEKQSLGPDDHDWVVLIAYALTEVDAGRAALADDTGIAADPPIPVTAETMRNHRGPLCVRCDQSYQAVWMSPCPGMPFAQYLAQLPDEIRQEVIARLEAQQGEREVLAEVQAVREEAPSGEPVTLVVQNQTIGTDSHF